jgi:hypothetical protein
VALWWEKWEGRLEKELQALQDAGIRHTLDEDAKQQGFIRLALDMDAGTGPLELTAVYPEHYPYFRVVVTAPTLDLHHHQHPFQKNLCLLGRRTHYWNPSDTLASLLVEQLPKLLNAAGSDTPPDRGLEAEQGEPVSEYFQYEPKAMVIVQSDWVIPEEHLHGTMMIATEGMAGSPTSVLLRGVVSEIRDANGNIVATADPRLVRPYAGPVVKASWVRATQVGASDKQDEVYQSLVNQLPALSRIVPANTTPQGSLRIIGGLFQEETAYRRTSDGWIFVCRVSPNLVARRATTGGKGTSKSKRNKR